LNSEVTEVSVRSENVRPRQGGCQEARILKRMKLI
jgi:hypothetical protein